MAVIFRVTQNSEIGQVSTDLVSYKILVDGEEYVDSNEITLGSTVSLQFDSIGHVTNGFHIRSCLATNEVESETAANYESLSLISNSCPVTSGHSALDTINPQVSDNTLTYNQFAFLDDTGKKTPTNIILPLLRSIAFWTRMCSRIW